jgi:hypothetical protein
VSTGRSLIILSALLAGAATAQSSSDTIDVTGRKPGDVRKEAQSFVRATGVADDGRAVARWVEPVCPHVLGVSADIGKRVADKVREVARDAGIRVGREPCRTNIAISFVGDGGALVRALATKAPNRLMEVAAENRAALLEGDAPIRWWHATEMRTKNGLGTTGNEAPPFAQLDGPGGVPMAGEVYFQYNSSIASTQMVRVMKAATVMPLDSVAAFAAMGSLAEVRPSDQPPAKSILNLFQGGGPRDLTVLDEKFLRALYRLPLDRTAFAQRGLLVHGLLNPADEEEP